jgi:hypothetical protein
MVERFSRRDPFFVLEAKRLPTPGGKVRQKEYVVGKKGGIERFKRGHHGAGLSQSAMVGYVSLHDYEHWLQQVNSWIKELTGIHDNIEWLEDDQLLRLPCPIGLGKYKSLHKRVDTTIITLYHYWIALM